MSNQINNEKNNQQFEYDLETQREYAISSGQLDNELKEEEEDNLLVETLEASVTDALEKISIILGTATRREAESHIVKKVLCSKCGIGVYVRQNMIEDCQYCAYCSNLEEEIEA